MGASCWPEAQSTCLVGHDETRMRSMTVGEITDQSREGRRMTRTGGCLCRAVRYECAGEPQFALQCHCRDCQLQSGAPHVAAVRMPSAAFRITHGSPKRYVAKADSGNEITRV